jgi:hypothetical protein
VFEDRKEHKNLVIEANSEIRKRLVDRKLKIGWHVCNNSDYLSVTRCATYVANTITGHRNVSGM